MYKEKQPIKGIKEHPNTKRELKYLTIEVKRQLEKHYNRQMERKLKELSNEVENLSFWKMTKIITDSHKTKHGYTITNKEKVEIFANSMEKEFQESILTNEKSKWSRKS